MSADSTFDLPAYKRAFEAKDVDAWLPFYADDAEWLEYKPTAPPSDPVRICGKAEIEHFLRGVAAAPVALEVSHEIADDRLAAFMVTCTFDSGRRVIENVICELSDGQIVRQIDVEAWD
ncbi:MAG: nuclear transport factor 2 family protein [Solirubrobacteraceae bacterium]